MTVGMMTARDRSLVVADDRQLELVAHEAVERGRDRSGPLLGGHPRRERRQFRFGVPPQRLERSGLQFPACGVGEQAIDFAETRQDLLARGAARLRDAAAIPSSSRTTSATRA